MCEVREGLEASCLEIGVDTHQLSKQEASRPSLTSHIMIVGECLHQSLNKKLQGLP